MIATEDRGPIRILSLSHGKANALDVELLDGLRDAVAEFQAGPARAGVLTSTGSMFCAGLDLKRVVDGGAPYLRRLLPALEGALESLFTSPKPLVAALPGHALAGGFILACACDRRLIAAGGAKVGLPELHVGVPFPTLVMEILRATVPPPRLQELLLVGGSRISAEALAAGLVDEVVPGDDLLDAACRVAERLGQLPPAAYALTKRKLRQPALDAWRREAGDGDAGIVDRWTAPETLAAIRDFVERTLR